MVQSPLVFNLPKVNFHSKVWRCFSLGLMLVVRALAFQSVPRSYSMRSSPRQRGPQ